MDDNFGRNIYTILVDYETDKGYRIVKMLVSLSENNFLDSVKRLEKLHPNLLKIVVQYVNKDTGETIKGPKYDTTQQKVKGKGISEYLRGVKQQLIQETGEIVNEMRKFNDTIQQKAGKAISRLFRKVISRKKRQKPEPERRNFYVMFDIENYMGPHEGKRTYSQWVAQNKTDLNHAVEEWTGEPWCVATDRVVQYIDPATGEVIKGPKYNTTTQQMDPEYKIKDYLKPNVRLKTAKDPKFSKPVFRRPTSKPYMMPQGHRIIPSQLYKKSKKGEEGDYTIESKNNFQENKNMSEINKFRSLIKECMTEVKQETDPRYRLKESLRGVVKNIINEFTTKNIPEETKEEKEFSDKQYEKDGNPRLDKTNEKQQQELETIVHAIDPTWEVYWDDHLQLIVVAQNLLYVRICPQFEDKYNVDAMVKLVDRVRAIMLTWDQVKAFIKANFSDLKKSTNADQLTKKSVDNETDDRQVKTKEAGPLTGVIKNRGEKKNGEDAKIKDTKKDDKDYNEKMTKNDEDLPDRPMKQVTEPGKDPEGKNHDIKKTDKPKAPKHKNDKELRITDKKTPKFSLKQVRPN